MNFVRQILVLGKPGIGNLFFLFLRVFVTLDVVARLELLLVSCHLGLAQVLEAVTLQFLLEDQLKSQLLLTEVVRLRSRQALEIL